MLINKYKIIHTGEKIHDGGLNNGLFKVKYHVDTDFIVKNEPIKPANWHINVEIINLGMSLMSI